MGKTGAKGKRTTRIKSKELSGVVLPAMVTRNTPRARLVKTAIENGQKRRKPVPWHICNSCFSSFTETFHCPCGHRYCRACLREMFRTGLADRSMLPIRCCGLEVDQSWSKAVMNSNVWMLLQEAMEERETGRRMYCPSRACSARINLDHVAQGHQTQFPCPGCKINLCSACLTAHPNLSCAQFQQLPADEKDSVDYDFRLLAQQRGYARCPQCRHYIEHAGGCYHMVCRCGRSFNYFFTPSLTTAPQA